MKYPNDFINKIICGDCLEVMKDIPDESIDCVITSPPYYGLRDYGTAKWEGGDPNCDHKVQTNIKEPNGDWDRPSRTESSKVGELLECVICHKSFFGKIGNKFCSTKCLNTLSNDERTSAESKRIDVCKCGAKRIDNQIGLEKTPEKYVKKLVQLFGEVKRVLKKEGTLWLNLGDSYSNLNWKEGKDKRFEPQTGIESENKKFGRGIADENLPSKSLMGIPWRVAFALQKDGWILRQDIIWHKPNPMPESVTDRCTKSHEYIFLLAKSQKYYFNNEAIKEPKSESSFNRVKYPRFSPNNKGYTGKYAVVGVDYSETEKSEINRNKRSVWTITTKPFKEAHFATFPEALIEPMVLAGCPKDGIVLDPFMGAGTTALVAKKLRRNYLGIELNPEYIKIAEKRLRQEILI